MYALDKIKHELAQVTKKILGVEITAEDFVVPPQNNLGDLSLPCFSLSKTLNKSPKEIAEEISKNFQHRFITKIEAIGPYANFILSQLALGEILDNFQKTKSSFGFNKSGQKQRVMIEYSNANTHKEYHVGHLRNIVFGEAVNKILAANGYEVIPVSYINDFGIHTAKTLWWLYHEHNHEAKAIMSQGVTNKGYFLGSQYTEASQRITGDETLKNEVAGIMKQIESRRGEMYKLWKQTRSWSLKQFAEIYKELNVKFKATFYENEFLEPGLKMVKALEAKGILIKSEGALIANLEKYNLGVLVVLRSDGTALYPVADLPLAITKIKRYKLAQSLYVVDVRQGLYFKQLFKLLELLGYDIKFEHLPYEFVKLPTGMMSSRTGNIIAYEDLKNEALQKAREEIIKRHAAWSKKQINTAAHVIAFGALKFEMIKVSASKQITFEINQALRFDGNTSAYLQYTYARLRSIARKAGKNLKVKNNEWQELTEIKERNLIVKLAKFPEVVLVAGQKKDPAEIAKYLFELAQLTNDYYHAVPVLKADKATGAARLALLNNLAYLIKQGLSLLGIEVVEEM